jgi:hypothetical protein
MPPPQLGQAKVNSAITRFGCFLLDGFCPTLRIQFRQANAQFWLHVFNWKRSIAVSKQRQWNNGRTTIMPIDQQPQNPYTGGFEKTPEQAQIEARAKVFWGDSPVEVIKYLQMQGIAYDEACIMVDEMYREREKAIRGAGLRKLILGFSLLAVPGITWLIFMHIGVIQFHLMAITAMVGLGGAWFCLKAIFMLVAPHTETGEIDEH